MKTLVASLVGIGLLVGACSGGDDDNTAFCDLVEENLKPFEVGEKIDLDAIREIVDAAPDDFRDAFTVYLALAEEINQLDLTDRDGSAEMLRRLAQADALAADKTIVDFRVNECGATVSDPSVDPN